MVCVLTIQPVPPIFGRLHQPSITPCGSGLAIIRVVAVLATVTALNRHTRLDRVNSLLGHIRLKQ